MTGRDQRAAFAAHLDDIAAPEGEQGCVVDRRRPRTVLGDAAATGNEDTPDYTTPHTATGEGDTPRG